jgi:cytidylate kinase
MAVITISRQYGSYGDEIARQVSQTLHYHLFDKRVLARMASRFGMAEGEFVDVNEDTHHRGHAWERSLIGNMTRFPAATMLQAMVEIRRREAMMVGSWEPITVTTWGEDTTGASIKETQFVSEKDEGLFLRDAILSAYQEGNFVIVGRGGQMILKDKPGVLHVRIVAPEDVRAEHLAAQQSLDETTAKKLIRQRDLAAADYIETLYHADWNDPLLYHLIINASKITMDMAVQTIVTAVWHLSSISASEPSANLPPSHAELHASQPVSVAA